MLYNKFLQGIQMNFSEIQDPNHNEDEVENSKHNEEFYYSNTKEAFSYYEGMNDYFSNMYQNIELMEEITGLDGEQVFRGINFYDSLPDGKPINKNPGTWFKITGSIPIIKMYKELMEYHMVHFDNYELPIMNIPDHITHVKITGKSYDYPLHLPSNTLVFYMILENKYMFDLNTLPENLRVLHIINELDLPIINYPLKLVKLVLHKYQNHDMSIVMPPNLIIFYGNIKNLMLIENVSSFLVYFDVITQDTRQLSPLFFSDKLLYFKLHGNYINVMQIMTLPDSVLEMCIQFNDDYNQYPFIKFPKMLHSLILEKGSSMNFNNILPVLTNLDHISIDYRSIIKFDPKIAMSLSSISFYKSSPDWKIVFSYHELLQLVNTNPEFTKYKKKLEYCISNSTRQTYYPFEENTEENTESDDEYLESPYNINIYDISMDYLDITTNRSQYKDDEQTRIIKKRIIRKYIHYVYNVLINRGIDVDYS